MAQSLEPLSNCDMARVHELMILFRGHDACSAANPHWQNYDNQCEQRLEQYSRACNDRSADLSHLNNEMDELLSRVDKVESALSVLEEQYNACAKKPLQMQPRPSYSNYVDIEDDDNNYYRPGVIGR